MMNAGSMVKINRGMRVHHLMTRGVRREGAEAWLDGNLEALDANDRRLASVLSTAPSGRQFPPQEFLAMQAGVYRLSQELELITKVLQKTTSGMRQTMNTQV